MVRASHSKRAIIIDNNDAFRNAIESVLLKRGYEVYALSETDWCPISLDESCPCSQDAICTNVLLLDVNKPRMTGLSFVKEQKRHGCKVPYIAVMSASWEEAEIADFERLGCRVFHKPIKMTELTDWLDVCEQGSIGDFILSELPVNPSDQDPE